MMKVFFYVGLMIFLIGLYGCTDIEDSAVAGGFGSSNELEDEEILDEILDEGIEELESSNFNCNPEWGVIIDGFDSSICFLKNLPEETMIFTRASGHCRSEIDLGDMKWDALSYDEAVAFVDYFSSRGIENINVYLAENYGFENIDYPLYWTGEFENAQQARSWLIDLSSAQVYWMDMSRTQKVICIARAEDN